MSDILIILITAIVALGVGVYIGRVLLQKVYKQQEEAARQKAKSIIREAEINAEGIKKDRMLEAKEKFLKLKSEFEEESNKKKNIIIQNENKVKQREQHVAKQMEQTKRRETELDKEKEALDHQLEVLKKRKEEVEQQHNEVVAQLEKIAGLTAAEAREQMVEALKSEATSHASSYVKDIVAQAKLTATKEAKKIVVETIQRTAAEHAIENCVSVFNIESDDIKGKIIGREGRNIRALEAATGVEIIVDDTPEAIIISGFDPVRREIARLSLHRLVQDGRIHPARIEEIVNKT